MWASNFWWIQLQDNQAVGKHHSLLYLKNHLHILCSYHHIWWWCLQHLRWVMLTVTTAHLWLKVKIPCKVKLVFKMYLKCCIYLIELRCCHVIWRFQILTVLSVFIGSLSRTFEIAYILIEWWCCHVMWQLQTLTFLSVFIGSVSCTFEILSNDLAISDLKSPHYFQSHDIKTRKKCWSSYLFEIFRDIWEPVAMKHCNVIRGILSYLHIDLLSRHRSIHLSNGLPVLNDK